MLSNRYDSVSRGQWNTGSFNGKSLAGDRNADQYYANYASVMDGFRATGNFAAAEATNRAHGFDSLFAPNKPAPKPSVISPPPAPTAPPTPSPQPPRQQQQSPQPSPSPQTQQLQNSVSSLQQQITSQNNALAEAKALAERLKPKDASKALSSTILTSPFGAKEDKKRQSFLTPFGA